MSPEDSTRPKSIHHFRDAVLSSAGPSSPTARLVAITLAQTMDRNTLESYAGAESIAERSALSLRAVKSNLGKLAHEGWLQERPKLKGRNYWLKVRRASIPAVPLGASVAPSQVPDSVQEVHGVPDGGLSATDTGLGARDDTTGCISAQNEGAAGAPDLLRRSRTDLEQDPDARARARSAASPAPANAGSAAPDSEVRELIRDLYRKGYKPHEIMTFRNCRGVTLEQIQAIAKHTTTSVVK